jgi:hypothetical protein
MKIAKVAPTQGNLDGAGTITDIFENTAERNQKRKT